MIQFNDYDAYISEVGVNWSKILWITDIITELVTDGVLMREEAQNFLDSLYYGEHWQEFI